MPWGDWKLALREKERFPPGLDEFQRGNETACGLETQSCVAIVTGGFGHGPLRDPGLQNPPVMFWVLLANATVVATHGVATRAREPIWASPGVAAWK